MFLLVSGSNGWGSPTGIHRTQSLRRLHTNARRLTAHLHCILRNCLPLEIGLYLACRPGLRTHSAMMKPTAPCSVTVNSFTKPPTNASVASGFGIRGVSKGRAVSVQAAVEEGDFVRVHYKGTLEDGKEFDSSRDREPLEFVVGSGKVVKGFETLVKGLEPGAKKTATVPADDAYGQWQEELTAKIPVARAPEGLEKGNVVQLSNGMRAQVTEMDEEFITIDANHELAGKSLTFEVEVVDVVPRSKMQTATFGAGCFWGVELAFQRVPGVVATSVGYSNGEMTDPTYEDVCSGSTGHAEVVQVLYDPEQVSFDTLLEVFFDRHDPTQLNRQGNDVGTQYRSGIYFHTPEQEAAAKAAIERFQEKYDSKIVTEVAECKNFYEAEPYHQQYLARGGRFGKPQSAAKGCSDPIRCYG